MSYCIDGRDQAVTTSCVNTMIRKEAKQVTASKFEMLQPDCKYSMANEAEKHVTQC